MKKNLIAVFVILIFMGFSHESKAQLFKTKLKVTVVDKLGNVVDDAKVILFKSKADYDKEINEVQPFKLTDGKGRVTFKNLEPIEYYIIVRKGDLDNFGGGEKISALSEGKVNKATIVITNAIGG